MIMIIIYISQPWSHQTTSNNHQYDAGIVLIDLHQLNMKTTGQYKSATLNTGQPHQRRTGPCRTTTRNIRFPNQMIEQINIALGKGSREFLSWVIEPAVGD